MTEDEGVLSRAVRYVVVPVAAPIFALTYALALAGTHLLFQAQPQATQNAWLAWTSTSLDSLSTHPVGSLLTSALVIEDDPLPWVALALVALWSAVRVLDRGRRVDDGGGRVDDGGGRVADSGHRLPDGGRRALDVGRRVPWRALALVIGVHVLATLASEGMLARRIALGDEPASARHVIDVGPSYLVVSALVAVIVAGRRVERILCAAGFVVVAPSLFEGLDRWDVTAVGHASTVVLAAAYGLWRRPGIRRRDAAIGGRPGTAHTS